jgi:hypothetical protein
MVSLFRLSFVIFHVGVGDMGIVRNERDVGLVGMK